MHGSGSLPFSELFASTCEVHGDEFAFNYYVMKHRMTYIEFALWLRVIGRAGGYYKL